ncbi:MAG: bis(5'-nucleosyl)-tetraphosphatase (symmetrical) YqeK [Clostridia bacterium]|jgi:predicted HD superfamily hydrolase involved in NAD metabolism|nr:bis(5'-nucleosyl)-tetraphosphatase (symmetrical) YqeK [Clostridia bacterium]
MNDKVENCIKDKVEDYIKENLSKERLEHTYRVRDVAIELAGVFEEEELDLELVEIAALMHDAAKEMPEEEKRLYCRLNFIILDDIFLKDIDLAHGLIASDMLENIFGCDEVDVLNAVKNHTFGRVKMSLLEKVIFIADYIEPKRKTPGVEEVREAAFEGKINLSVKLAVDNTMKFLYNNDMDVHPMSQGVKSYAASKAEK